MIQLELDTFLDEDIRMSAYQISILLPVLSTTLLASGHGLARHESPTDKTAKAAASELAEVNASCRAAYRAARERALARSGPVVLFNGDELVFRYGDTRRVSKITPAIYTDLKTVAHVALGLAGLLSPPEPGPLDPARLFALKGYRETIEKARKAIELRGLTRAQRQRQEKILDSCDELLSEVIRGKKIEVKAVAAGLRKLRLPLELNTAEAARAQIDSLHRAMSAWKEKLSEEEWGQLKVVVQGSAMPRKGHMAVQYFARLLGETGEGRRIIYAEALFDETRALALLGTHLLDTQLGADVYDDPQRLHRDLLADAAKGYLDELFAPKKD
jgi:hypothetical protein